MAASDPEEKKSRRSNRTPSTLTSTKRAVYKTGPFSDEEKELLLSALYAYGPNVDKIEPLITSRSREQVRDFLTGWYRRVKKVPVVLSDKDRQTALIKEPIESWLEQIKTKTADYVASNPGTLPTPWYPYALGYTAKFEQHPHPSATGGVDFRKLYEFLETMLSGNVPTQLSFPNAVFMLSSLRKLKLRLDNIDFHKDEVHFKRPAGAAETRTYKRIKKDPDENESENTEVESLLSSKIMNPLKVPMECLSVKKRLKSQPTICEGGVNYLGADLRM